MFVFGLKVLEAWCVCVRLFEVCVAVLVAELGGRNYYNKHLGTGVCVLA